MRYLLAGTVREERRWLAENGHRDAFSLRYAYRMEGRRVGPDDTLELVGTWARRPDLREVLERVDHVVTLCHHRGQMLEVLREAVAVLGSSPDGEVDAINEQIRDMVVADIDHEAAFHNPPTITREQILAKFEEIGRTDTLGRVKPE